MKSLLSLILVALIGSASAATVSVTVSTFGAGSKLFADVNGVVLDVGSAVRVGYFDPKFGSLSALNTSNDYNQLNSLFVPLGEHVATDPSFPRGTVSGDDMGMYTMSINNPMNTATSATGVVFGSFVGVESTYIPTGVDLSVWVFNNADPTLATQWGIFSALNGWEFPAGLGSSTLNTNEVDIISRGSGTSGQLRLAAVPEPSSLVMLVALGGLMRRVRRR
jgi:hypothetical protein